VKEEKWDHRDQNAWSVTASQGLSAGTAGRFARIIIMKAEAEQTVYVVIESKASSRTAAAQDEDDAKSLHARIEKRVTSK
jgi:hypothetical protein